MAKATLPTNYKDDIMASSMGGKRRYNLIQNSDGTVSLEDVTDYEQVGSNFGAAQMNQTNTAVNNSADKSKIIDSLADVAANTQAGMMAGALAVRELNDKLSIASLFGIENAYANGMCDNALYINLNDPHGQENKTCIVNGGSTENIPSDLAWGIREVLYLSSNAIIVRITGIKTDGVTNVIFTNIYNYGKWTGWYER